MNGRVLNGSKSSICSPVPMNMMGLFVAATLGYQRKNIQGINPLYIHYYHNVIC